MCAAVPSFARIVILILLYSTFTYSHPIRRESREDYDLKDMNFELKLPNGTIVGKYNYTDNDGNPIEVKYYADESSYGVELKSVKTQVFSTKQPQYSSIPQKLSGSHVLMRGVSENYEKPKSSQTQYNHRQDYLKPSSDYEVYTQKEVKAPKTCTNEKVRVYLNTEKRTPRKVADDKTRQMTKFGDEYLDEMSRYCQQLV